MKQMRGMSKRWTLRTWRSRQSRPSADFRQYLLSFIYSISFPYKKSLKALQKKKSKKISFSLSLSYQKSFTAISGAQGQKVKHIYFDFFVYNNGKIQVYLQYQAF